jgi:hypothetical protein
MQVIERGTTVRRLAPAPTPDSTPITLSQQGLVDKIAFTETDADVEWSVSGHVLGEHMRIAERIK